MSGTVDDRISKLWRAGVPRQEIRSQLGCSEYRIDKVRDDRGLPKRKAGATPIPDAELFEARTEPGDDGHVHWIGSMNRDGIPRARGTTGYRLAWKVATGAEPPGIVQPTCDMLGCVAFAHLACRTVKDIEDVAIDRGRLADLLAERTLTVPGGHHRWIAHVDQHGVPLLRYGHPPTGYVTTAGRFVWFLNTGRAPAGRVRATCGTPHCLAFAHLTDTRTTTPEDGPR